MATRYSAQMLISLGVSLAFAQSAVVEDAAPAQFAEDDGKSAQACRIVDPAHIDTYNELYYVSFTDSLATRFSRAYIDEMITGNDPDAWPVSLRVDKKRSKVAAELGQVVGYRVAVLPNEASVVWLPADENQGVDPRLHFDRDLYVMVSPGGLVPLAGSRAIPDTGPSVAESAPVAASAPSIDVARFGGQLDAVIVAMTVDFASIKGALRPKSGAAFMEPDSFESTIQLDGAVDTTFWGTGTGATLFADYGDYTDPKVADAVHASLVAAVDAAPKPCCALVKDRIFNDGYIVDAYLPFDPGQQMDPRLANMVLEVEFRKGLGMGADNKLVDTYSVGLRVRRQ